MSAPPVTTRFAPSPTGFLHLGNARTALFNFLFARHSGGRFLVRAEDTDAERSEERYLEAALDDLEWLGVSWDAAPDKEDAAGPYRQSQRGDIYEALFRKLDERDAVYPCFCTPAELSLSRKTQIAAGKPPRYDGRCAGLSKEESAARLASGTAAATRFRVSAGDDVRFTDLVRGEQRFRRADIGDFVIRRADGSPAFFFGNAVDDALMGISHVLRGEDHVANTPRQLLLLDALGLQAPQYGHISLLVGPDNAPLSKRHGSTGVRDLRERGFLSRAVVNYMARLGHVYEDDGWLSDERLVAGFELTRLGKSPAHYDEHQLLHWQREAVNHASGDSVKVWLAPTRPKDVSDADWSAFVDVVKPNVLFPRDATAWVEIVFGNDVPVTDTPDVDADGAFYTAAVAALDAHGPDLKQIAAAVKEATGAKGKALFMPLRLAVTGRTDGPELGPLLKIIPTATLRARLNSKTRQPESR